MLHDELKNYLQQVETSVGSIANCHIEKFEEEILTPKRLNLRIRIRFSKGHLLELNEALIIERGNLQHLSYRYHFQNHLNKLIFRYDNTPHFPKIKTFPHHKHLSSKVIHAPKPTINDIIEEVKIILGHQK